MRKPAFCISENTDADQLCGKRLCFRYIHYANTPMQYTAIFNGCKNVNFQVKKIFFFLFLLKTLIVGTH